MEPIHKRIINFFKGTSSTEEINMEPATNIERLTLIKDLLAKVYEEEVKDDLYDNGNLDNLNNSVKYVEDALRVLKSREPSE